MKQSSTPLARQYKDKASLVTTTATTTTPATVLAPGTEPRQDQVACVNTLMAMLSSRADSTTIMSMVNERLSLAAPINQSLIEPGPATGPAIFLDVNRSVLSNALAVWRYKAAYERRLKAAAANFHQ